MGERSGGFPRGISVIVFFLSKNPPTPYMNFLEDYVDHPIWGFILWSGMIGKGFNARGWGMVVVTEG